MLSILPCKPSQFPATIICLVFLILEGLVHGTWSGPLADSVRAILGHSASHMSNGAWDRILSSLFVTGDPLHLFLALIMILFCVGTLERQAGSWIAIASFLIVHLLTLLIQSSILLIVHAWVDQEWSLRWSITPDVGPSAGYYGCLGVVIARWQSPARRWMALTILGILLIRWIVTSLIFDDSHFQSDMAHAIAFPVGLAIGILFSYVSKHPNV